MNYTRTEEIIRELEEATEYERREFFQILKDRFQEQFISYSGSIHLKDKKTGVVLKEIEVHG